MKSKYEFESNLLRLSENIMFDEALSEWSFITNDKRESNDLQCICQHKVKHFKYMHNAKTMKTIIVGSSCYKKFNLTIPSMKNTIYRTILADVLGKGEYNLIDDVFEYSEKVKYELINYFKPTIMLASIKQIEAVCIQINDLINDYGLQYLQELLDEIQKRINHLDELRIEKEFELKAKASKEIEQNYTKINKSKEQCFLTLQQIKEQCNCKITCRCECIEPEFRKVFNSLHCNTCLKWRCIHEYNVVN